ncbi:single-stranded-DNA-specific exonuclease RecJ [Metabacillus herbersteinensis]|uniref:Single-stranded-DNA-specific exonuclease RecJ n=1 Tax=Metabacillus herbersteinensis TaxID=283816 RepID=A0ABV6G9Q3_9BACI
MLKAKTRWTIQPSDEKTVQALVNELSITPLVASLLVKRGYTSVEAASEFLKIEEQTFHDPYLLKDMDIAVQRINDAIKQSERILVYGDYDADGVSSTTVLLTTLQKLGADVDYYIPNRFSEGYGPNETAFRKAHENKVNLIITVDTGISAVHEASIAKELGVDLIITDHHEPGPVLPDALAILHPKQSGCSYPFKDLAGVGVALKLAHALLGEIPKELLELAAIGTIADLVPLHGENRLIARRGIQQLKETKRIGLRALLKVAGSNQSEVNEETIGFALAPRINAVGRLQSADPAVDLLMTELEEEAFEIANGIDLLNKERQKNVSTITEEAIEEVEKSFPISENSVLVIAKEGWNPGVVGIVASKLVEKYYRPTIILCIDNDKGIAKGSARSIAGFDLFESLSECRDILPHFGGHPMAAGMTLNMEHVDELRSRLIKIADSTMTQEDFTPITTVDVRCSLEEVTVQSIEEMHLLAPFGMSNPKPVVLIEDVTLGNVRKIGTNQNHLKMVLEVEGTSIDCVGFGYGYVHDELSPATTLSAIGQLSINEWNNFRKPQLMLQDLCVNEWQLFDHRGTNNIEKLIQTISKVQSHIITFQHEMYERVKKIDSKAEVSFIQSKDEALNINVSNKYVVFVDTPPSTELLYSLFDKGKPERVYAIFLQENDNFFATIPTRDHFKWFYGYLLKRGPFDLKHKGEELARHRGWSKETIEFMSKVFFELEFVTIENGIISIQTQSSKRDLSESILFAKKQQQIELEKMLLYTSYQQLKLWFNEHMNSTSKLVNV